MLTIEVINSGNTGINLRLTLLTPKPITRDNPEPNHCRPRCHYHCHHLHHHQVTRNSSVSTVSNPNKDLQTRLFFFQINVKNKYTVGPRHFALHAFHFIPTNSATNKGSRTVAYSHITFRMLITTVLRVRKHKHGNKATVWN